MGLLQTKVTTELEKKPLFMLLYGVEGIGKSTFAANFEKPLFYAAEDGVNHLAVSKISDLENANDFESLLDELITTKHEYKTFVIDTIDHLEHQIFDQVCKEGGKKSIAEFGYGAGYAQALQKWKSIGSKLKQLRNKMNVVLLAHSEIKTIHDPKLPEPYDKYVIKLHRSASAYLRELVDAVFFANYEISVAKGQGQPRAKAIGDGTRLMFTMAMPAHEGKNRYGLPYQLEFDYDAFIKEMKATDPTDIDSVKTRIAHYISQIEDEKAKQAAEKKFGANEDNFLELQKLETKLKRYTEVH